MCASEGRTSVSDQVSGRFACVASLTTTAMETRVVTHRRGEAAGPEGATRDDVGRRKRHRFGGGAVDVVTAWELESARVLAELDVVLRTGLRAKVLLARN